MFRITSGVVSKHFTAELSVVPVLKRDEDVWKSDGIFLHFINIHTACS
jgi:hypothetical protein